jgi:hypothetical protein
LRAGDFFTAFPAATFFATLRAGRFGAGARFFRVAMTTASDSV